MIYKIPALRVVTDLAALKQSDVTDAGGTDGTNGYNTAINAILDVLDTYGMTA
jgi:hypothetical protein